MSRMEFELHRTDGAARRGRITFPRGTVETPAFMPVGTYGTVKGMLPGQLRALESALVDGDLQPFAGETSIFILPGYRIRSVDALLTNFHLPESTLLMLVSAFSGRERILAAYAHAVRERYRFFSYGDAMLLYPEARA